MDTFHLLQIILFNYDTKNMINQAFQFEIENIICFLCTPLAKPAREIWRGEALRFITPFEDLLFLCWWDWRTNDDNYWDYPLLSKEWILVHKDKVTDISS